MVQALVHTCGRPDRAGVASTCAVHRGGCQPKTAAAHRLLCEGYAGGRVGAVSAGGQDWGIESGWRGWVQATGCNVVGWTEDRSLRDNLAEGVARCGGGAGEAPSGKEERRWPVMTTWLRC